MDIKKKKTDVLFYEPFHQPTYAWAFYFCGGILFLPSACEDFSCQQCWHLCSESVFYDSLQEDISVAVSSR